MKLPHLSQVKGSKSLLFKIFVPYHLIYSIWKEGFYYHINLAIPQCGQTMLMKNLQRDLYLYFVQPITSIFLGCKKTTTFHKLFEEESNSIPLLYDSELLTIAERLKKLRAIIRSVEHLRLFKHKEPQLFQLQLSSYTPQSTTSLVL